MKNGDKVKDNVTGLTGTITATITYLHDETLYLMEGKTENGDKNEKWGSEKRFAIIQ